MKRFFFFFVLVIFEGYKKNKSEQLLDLSVSHLLRAGRGTEHFNPATFDFLSRTRNERMSERVSPPSVLPFPRFSMRNTAHHHCHLKKKIFHVRDVWECKT